MNPAHPVNKIMAAVRRLTDALDAAEDADTTIALNAVRPELDVLLRSIARADANYRRVTEIRASESNDCHWSTAIGSVPQKINLLIYVGVNACEW